MSFEGFEKFTLTDGEDTFASGDAHGGVWGATIDARGGDDVIKGAGLGSLIYTGDGDDKVFFAPGVGVADLSFSDRISLGGVLTLYGGLRNANSSPDDPYAKSFGGLVEWGKNGDGELVIRMPWWNYTFTDKNGGQHNEVAEMYVLNWQRDAVPQGFGGAELGPGNIVLAEYDITAYNINDPRPSQSDNYHTWELFGLFTKTIMGYSAWMGVDPLVVDLDGDGLELRGQTSASPLFDVDADLYAERTGWVQRDDGILVRDLNADSVIADSSEMFGGTGSGFDALALLDGNHDGVVNASDNGLADFNHDGVVNSSDTFAALKIWKDEDGDAKTDAGELHALSDYNIVGISLTTTAVNQTVEANLVTRTSTFIKGDASTGTIGDVTLRIDNSHTTYQGAPITVSTAAAAAADLKGFGTLVDLHQALTLHPELIATVETALDGVTGPDIAAIRGAVLPALTAWAEGSPIRLANGSVVSGAAGMTQHPDVPVFAHEGTILDYAWKVEADEVLVGGQTREHGVWTFVSGAKVEVTAALSQPLPSLPDLPVTTGTGPTVTVSTVVIEGEDYTRHAFSTAGGDEVVVTWKASLGEPAVADALVADSLAGAWDTVLGSEISFIERFLGETMPFTVKPDDPAAALVGMHDALANMNTTLDLLGVRLAVQTGGLASVFEGINYDVAANGFVGTAGQQLTPVYQHILELADAQTDPGAYLEAWKPILDVIIGDYSQGNTVVLNTHGFLAQNLIGAFEAVDPAFSLVTAAEALGLPPELLVTGAGSMAGSNDADIFYLDGSDQTAAGGLGPDTYIVGAQIGHDVITDVEPVLTGQVEDIVRFTTLDAEDVTATRDGLDLVLTVDSTSETLRITNQFTGVWPGFTGGNFWDDNGVGRIIFADGESWSKLDMARAVSRPSTGLVEGTEAVDVLESGASSDTLSGMGASDLYLVHPGGSDIIHDGESNQFREAMDVVSFEDGVSLNDLAFTRGTGDHADDLIIGFYGSDDTLTIHNQFTATQTGVFGTWWFDQIELFTFQDGEMLNNDDVMSILLRQSQSDGDDVVFGFHVNDTLDGGGGNDLLSGGDGDDTYRFGLNYGHDTIHESLDNLLSGTNDRVQFGPGIDAADVTFHFGATKDDLLVTLSDGGTIDVIGQFHQTFAGFTNIWFNRIESFEFFNGDSLSWSQILLDVIANQDTPGADTIFGSDMGDTLDGGAGNDLLTAGNGDDTYVFGLGYGADTIDDQEDNILSGETDIVVFKSDIAPGDLVLSRGADPADLVITVAETADSLTIKGEFPDVALYAYGINQVEELHFSNSEVWDTDDIKQRLLADAKTSGDDLIRGFAGSDRIDGGGGADSLIGGDGADTYVFARGDGQDRIDDQVQTTFSAPDVVEFGTGIAAGDLIIGRDGDDMIITLKDPVTGLAGTDQLRLVGQFDLWSSDIVEEFRFVDAPSAVVTAAELSLQFISNAGTSGDDHIVGSQGADTMDGKGGNDTLEGGDGNDVYLFDVGDGADVIHDINDNQNFSSVDTIRFASGIAPSQVSVVRDGYDATFSISGHTDTLKVVGYFGSGFERVETIAFADSTTWDYATVLAKTLGYTTGDDSIIGDGGANTLQGGGGNDTISGFGGEDVYLYNAGDGDDRIYDSYAEGYADQLKFGAGLTSTKVVIARDGENATLTFTGETGSVYLDKMFGGSSAGPDQLVFADAVTWDHTDLQNAVLARSSTTGNDAIAGFGTADTLTGGAGNDTLSGQGSDDVYVYNLGDGQDRIYEGGFEGWGDGIKLGAGITTASVTVSRPGGGDDIKLTFSDGGSILLQGQLNGHAAGIETVTFADTTVWDYDDILAQLPTYTSGDDNIVGDGGANTLQGGAGNDTLSGQGSDDVYVYNLGDGQDRVYEGGFEGWGDQLKLGTGITTANIIVNAAGDDLKLIFTDGGSILLQGQNNGHAAGIEAVTFADATTWDAAALSAHIGPTHYIGSPTNTILIGTNSADYFDSMGYATREQGGAGADVFIYNSGYGFLEISNWTGSSSVAAEGVLKFGAGIHASDLTARIADHPSGYSSLFLYDGVTGDEIILESMVGHTDCGVVQATFADGSSLTRAQLLDLVNTQPAYNELVGSVGNTVLIGTSGADRFDSMGIATREQGGAGADVFVYNSGYGFLEISNWTGSTSVAAQGVLKFGVGIHATDLTARIGEHPAGYSSLFLYDSVTGDEIILESMVGHTDCGVASAKFADGSSLSAAELLALATSRFEGSSGADTVTGSTGGTVLKGNDGGDLLTGNTGSDSLNGGTGDDQLSGGDGADTLLGGAGQDTLTGGAGSDVFKLAALTDSPLASADIIVDFALGADTIDLSALDAVSGTSGDQAFTFIGSSAFSNVAGQLRIDNTVTGKTILLGDVGGDGAADFAIELTGSLTMTSSDLVL